MNSIGASQERAQDLNALCIEQGFALFLAWGTILQGSVMTAQGEGEQGISYIQRGLAIHQATGGALRQPYWLGLLADAYSRVGDVEKGLIVLADALDVGDKTEERWYEAELYRLKGESLLRQNLRNADEATQCFHNALATARAQGAKAWELRATMSLGRLLASQGRRAEARAMLADIYNWFTEGFDTTDLKDARALLDELTV